MSTYRFDAATGRPIMTVTEDALKRALAIHEVQFDGFGRLAAAQGRIKIDTAAQIALERELTKISAVTSTEPLADLTSLMHFPTTPDAPAPGQKSYTSTGVNWSAGRVSHSYDDLGSAGTLARTELQTSIIIPHILTADYTWGDLAAAGLANQPLQSYLLQGARRKVNEEINQFNWFGDTGTGGTGVVGIYNNASITKAVVANGGAGLPGWNDKTPAEIELDCVDMLGDLFTQIKGLGGLVPNRLVMGTTQYAKIATTYSAQYLSQTILERLLTLFRAAYSADFQIVSAPELVTGGGGGGTSAWMLAYRYDSMVAGRVVALEGVFETPFIKPFVTSIPYHAETGGINVRMPVAMLIRYGM
tara:strand:- start:6215 stop:7294 length:1080 start_codon:yes stop_codon:yes gene_type:complete